MRDVTSFCLFLHGRFLFLLTRPMRDVTTVFWVEMAFSTVSTHTPHAGRDWNGLEFNQAMDSFYSHAPCGT